jgi:putative hydrolase of the HAD superfamily
MAALSWIFFDLFDTLCTVDEAAYYGGKRAAAEAAGINFEAFLAAWKSTSAEASIGRIKTPFDRAARALAMLGVYDRAAVGEVARRDVETILASVVYYEGAPECLTALRSRGFRLGLISNATATTAFVVAPLKLREHLDSLVFSYEAGVVKPDPAIFQKALERPGAVASRSLFVGDGANRELDAARSLGFSTLCMDHPRKALSFRDPDGLSSPDHPRVTSFPDLLALVGDAAPG